MEKETEGGKRRGRKRKKRKAREVLFHTVEWQDSIL